MNQAKSVEVQDQSIKKREFLRIALIHQLEDQSVGIVLPHVVPTQIDQQEVVFVFVDFSLVPSSRLTGIVARAARVNDINTAIRMTFSEGVLKSTRIVISRGHHGRGVAQCDDAKATRRFGDVEFWPHDPLGIDPDVAVDIISPESHAQVGIPFLLGPHTEYELAVTPAQNSERYFAG